jgi:hypothetical protein
VRIAVVGSGIGGLSAARSLATRHDVVVFEAADRAGGHVYTVEADGHAIDMGFIVCNRARYPRFFEMLRELGISTRPTTMTFSIAGEGFEWSTGALRLRDWRLLVQVGRFVRRARREIDEIGDITLDEYLRGESTELRERFAIPLAAALWSLAPARCGAFPAITYLRFLDQHGMLKIVRPLPWETIVGGSVRYVDALLAKTTLALRLNTRVRRIARDSTGVDIDGERFDRVVLATHADQALAMLAEPTADERRVLGAFRYSANRTVLHTDRRFLPRDPRLHAAWNHVATSTPDTVAVTYSMTKLQGLPDAPYLVTLNPHVEPRGALHEVAFRHPQFDRVALAAQRELPRLAGPHTAYAGAYFGFGFHEDGMRSGIAAAARFAGQ